MCACGVLRFNPSAAAAPLGPLTTQSVVSSFQNVASLHLFHSLDLARRGRRSRLGVRSARGTFSTGPADRITALHEVLQIPNIAWPVTWERWLIL